MVMARPVGCHGCGRKTPMTPEGGSVPRTADDEFDGLLAWLREEGVEGYPPILGLSGSLRATLMYLRQNIVQAVIGEILGVSQPTVSRAIKEAYSEGGFEAVECGVSGILWTWGEFLPATE